MATGAEVLEDKEVINVIIKSLIDAESVMSLWMDWALLPTQQENGNFIINFFFAFSSGAIHGYHMCSRSKFSNICCLLDRCEYSYTINEGVHRYDQPPKKIPMFLPKPPFIPRRLVRISDMKAIQGSKVNKGYCTIYYPWNQSAELVKNEATREIDRVD
ncbi:hypothetical protein BDC45DRAFT_542785 [Circinella umbellata]|nr:hypothetical protein BDC45DRAFT_542785 [Circinella umbellata]